MDHGRFIPPDATLDMPGEALPLVLKTVERNPHQAYCETVTSSSRSSSPRSLAPSPLRIRQAPSLQIEFDLQTPANHDQDRNNSLIRAAASFPEPFADPVSLLKTGKDCKTQTKLANCDTQTESTRSNHITRAAIPRGSHSLALDTVTAYDMSPSHSRIQQVISPGSATAHTIPRKPISRNKRHTGTYYRSLPSLPPGEDPFMDEHSPGGEVYDEEDHEQGSKRVPFPTTTLIAGGLQDTYQIKRRPVPSLYDCEELKRSRENIANGVSLSFDSLKVPLRPYIHDSSSGLRQDVPHGHSQFIAADASHIPRGRWSDIDNASFTPLRLQPKDALSMQQYGQLPLLAPEISPPTPPHRDMHTQLAKCLAKPSSSPAASLRASIDIQNGPRPPPWGSYDNLELQRRQRSEARERMQTRELRLTADSALTCQKPYSTESLAKEPTSEVDEYREQILVVYPDMAFDGEAGMRARERCCCILM